MESIQHVCTRACSLSLKVARPKCFCYVGASTLTQFTLAHLPRHSRKQAIHPTHPNTINTLFLKPYKVQYYFIKVFWHTKPFKDCKYVFLKNQIFKEIDNFSPSSSMPLVIPIIKNVFKLFYCARGLSLPVTKCNQITI